MNTFPIYAIYTSGSTLYAVVKAVIAGSKKTWNPTLNAGLGAWETYNSANWSQYPVAMTEDAGSGYYSAAYPNGLSSPVNVLTVEAVYLQSGGSPALGDSPIYTLRSQGANVASVAGEPENALSLGASLSSQRIGMVSGTPTALSFVTDLTESTDDMYIGRILIMTSGGATAQVQYISAYDGTTKAVTLAGPLVTVPAANDEFVII